VCTCIGVAIQLIHGWRCFKKIVVVLIIKMGKRRRRAKREKGQEGCEVKEVGRKRNLIREVERVRVCLLCACA
jgi:hypothetical protein